METRGLIRLKEDSILFASKPTLFHHSIDFHSRRKEESVAQHCSDDERRIRLRKIRFHYPVLLLNAGGQKLIEYTFTSR
jgi:hypothetical protein